MSVPKLIAEGAPVEEQIVLGWTLDTHPLLLKLPGDKYDAWIRDLRELRTHQVINYKGIKALVGKLNHIVLLIPLAHHFLTRFRALINRGKPQHQQIATLKVLPWGEGSQVGARYGGPLP